MTMKKIKIDGEKCVGCGLCVNVCQEGAIGLIEGKAALVRDDYCDGLGNCLPVCPTEAISFEDEERETESLLCGCPGTYSKPTERGECTKTHLNQWPVQIKLVPPNAPYFNNAKLLFAADCTAYAYGNFHDEYMKDSITLIGCPKLDDGDYAEKLTNILKINEIKSVTVARMEVPCCGGIENAVKTALQNCGKLVPWQVATISTDGRIVGNYYLSKSPQ